MAKRCNFPFNSPSLTAGTGRGFEVNSKLSPLTDPPQRLLPRSTPRSCLCPAQTTPARFTSPGSPSTSDSSCYCTPDLLLVPTITVSSARELLFASQCACGSGSQRCRRTHNLCLYNLCLCSTVSGRSLEFTSHPFGKVR